MGVSAAVGRVAQIMGWCRGEPTLPRRPNGRCVPPDYHADGPSACRMNMGQIQECRLAKIC